MEVTAAFLLLTISLGASGASTASSEVCGQEDTYECRGTDALCVPTSAICNGVPDCPEGNDESVSLCGCMEHEFRCYNACLSIIHRCDTRTDCLDGSDEQDCESFLCPATHFKCRNDFCVPQDSVCDFFDNCGDNSDEDNCEFRKCWYGEFTCLNQQCVRAYSVCDGRKDCIDGSDELQCEPEHFVSCGDGQKVHRSLWCDDWLDCPINQADELNCRTCRHDEFTCANTRCISRANVCDSVCDCAAGCEDETNCDSRYSVAGHLKPCRPHTMVCHKTKRCLAPEALCDGRNDCRYGELGADEFGCNVSRADCGSGQVWCSEGRCLPKVARCNFLRDCLDGEDELRCEFRACDGKTEFRCESGQCVNASRRCDNLYDCKDLTDELNCEGFPCPPTHRPCRGGQCVPSHLWCNFWKDCLDGSDEEDCGPQNAPCAKSEFRCANGQCVSSDVRCYKSGNPREGCADGTHLKDCQEWICKKEHLKCRQSFCLNMSLVCNQHVECENSWTDEEQECTFICSEEKRCSCLDVSIDCIGLGLERLPRGIEREISKVLMARNRVLLEPTTFKGLDHVTFMDLTSNGILKIPPKVFNNLWRLKILDLSFNNISVLYPDSFYGLSNLMQIHLKGNKIKEIQAKAFNGLSALTSLDLKNQMIANVSNNAFMGLRMLNLLDLSSNCLESLYDGAFNGLDRLASLDVSNNKLVVIGHKTFHGLASLRKLQTDEFRFCCLVEGVACEPKPDEFSSCTDLMSNALLRICVWVLGALAISGNALVVFWRLAYPSKNKVHSFLITNLAIGDFLMGVYLVIIASVDLHFRGVYFIHDLFWRESSLCQMAGFLSSLSSELSVFTLTVITLERFVCIIFPFRVRRLSARATRALMGGVWAMCLMLAGVPLVHPHYYGRSGVCLALHITPHRPPGWQFSVAVFLGLNFVSFSLIAAAYSWMFVAARRTQRIRGQSRGESTMARRMALIVLTDFCCWMPIILLGVASLLGAVIPDQVFAWVAVFVLPLNAAVNPLLYTLSSTAPARPPHLVLSVTGDTQKSIIISMGECKSPLPGDQDPRRTRSLNYGMSNGHTTAARSRSDNHM